MKHTIKVASSITLVELNRIIIEIFGSQVGFYYNNKRSYQDYLYYDINYDTDQVDKLIKLEYAVAPNYGPAIVPTVDLTHIHGNPIIELSIKDEFDKTTAGLRFKLINFSISIEFKLELNWDSSTTLSNYHVDKFKSAIRQRLIDFNGRFNN